MNMIYESANMYYFRNKMVSCCVQNYIINSTQTVILDWATKEQLRLWHIY